MENNLDKIIINSDINEKENQEFRLYLKGYDHHKVDELVHRLNKKYSAEIDCTKCANCCGKLTPAFSLEEIKNIADHLEITVEEFQEKYVEREMAEGFILKGEKCPFLENNKCLIYDHRPEPCRTYPHLHEDNINHRLLEVIDNAYICPIVYNVLEELKDKLGK